MTLFFMHEHINKTDAIIKIARSSTIENPLTYLNTISKIISVIAHIKSNILNII